MENTNSVLLSISIAELNNERTFASVLQSCIEIANYKSSIRAILEKDDGSHKLPIVFSITNTKKGLIIWANTALLKDVKSFDAVKAVQNIKRMKQVVDLLGQYNIKSPNLVSDILNLINE